MNRTPFYEIHKALGGKLIEFAGWEMPVMYTSIIQEHHAVRERAGIFDVSHMGDFFIRGEGATEFLRYLLPTDVSKLKPGQETYTHILNEEGIILDDTIIMRLRESEYLLVPNAATTQKIYNHIAPLLPENVELDDRSREVTCIALQGPLSDKILGKLTDYDLSTIEFFNFVPVMIKDGTGKETEITVSFSGYTGEKGYELYSDNTFGPVLWNLLMEAGKEEGILPCGLGARDTLRLEKGFLLSGTDFNDDRTTIETNAEWLIDWDHDFIGKKALLAQKEKGDYERFTGILMEGRAFPRHGMEVVKDEKKVGIVTSGTLSPILSRGIALGYLKSGIEQGAEVEVLIRGKGHPGEVKAPPFV